MGNLPRTLTMPPVASVSLTALGENLIGPEQRGLARQAVPVARGQEAMLVRGKLAPAQRV